MRSVQLKGTETREELIETLGNLRIMLKLARHEPQRERFQADVDELVEHLAAMKVPSPIFTGADA